MRSISTLKRLFRTYCRAGARYTPSLDERNPIFRKGVSTRRLDDGRYPVICTSMTNYALLGAANYIGRRLAGGRALFIVWFTSSMRAHSRVERVLTALAIYRQKFPEHRFLFLCNEQEERDAFVAAGMSAVLCSHNAFVDETIYRPIPTTERVYDAIYNGSIAPQKRRHLARLIPKAAHIYGAIAPSMGMEETLTMLAEMRRLMPKHDFLNKVEGNAIAKLSREEVYLAIASSATGLCLSAHEGAMFASIEYLVAGLPVVSTRATGGREIFGSPDTWLTVADTAEAVRDGVAEMKGRTIAPQRVRDITLIKVREHRARLREAILTHTKGVVELPADYGSEPYRRMVDWMDGPTMVGRGVGD